MEQVKKVYLTFDLDFTNYCDNYKNIDEFNFIIDILLPFLDDNSIRATWFIRLDKGIELSFGRPDYLFYKYSEIINTLKDCGHSIGWHPHFYKFNKQNCNEDDIIEEINYLYPFIIDRKLKLSRIGWGFMTNKIMQTLEDLGVQRDSTAIPRPNYSFEEATRDWTITSQLPYQPSYTDYRREPYKNEKTFKIVEFPITTFLINAPYDNSKVVRYCNLSFKNTFIKKGIVDTLKNQEYLLTITHPYELMPVNNHLLISFNIKDFKKNINTIKKLNYNILFEVL